MRRWFIQGINKIKPLVEKYIDGICSFLLILCLFFDCFFIRDDIQVGIVCNMMELYVLYYCEKKLNKWAMLNLMLAFYGIVRIF